MQKKKKSRSQNDKIAAVKPFETGLQSGFENKEKFPLWTYPETLEAVEQSYRQDNCRSKSEFIEKAVKFYLGYLKLSIFLDTFPPKF